MTQKFGRVAAALLATTLAGTAYAQDVTIVLSEELDIVDPCEASRSNVGRVVMQNIAETMTELVPGSGLQPRRATSWEDQGGGTRRPKLRDAVTFTDGSALDAAHGADTLARIKSDPQTPEIGAKYFGGIDLTTNDVE